MTHTTLLTETTTELQTDNAQTVSNKVMTELYERYYQLVHRICYRYTKNREEASDLAQEVFLKVHGNYRTFEGNSQPSTWLYRVATNHCLDHLRWKKRQGELLAGFAEDLSSRPTQDTPIDNPTKRLFRRLLDGLDAVNRQVVFLRFEVGLTHEEIAEICGVSRVAITKRLAKFQANVALLKSELTDDLEAACETTYARATTEESDDV